MPDKLVVSGLGKSLDGTYEFDIADMLVVGSAGSLNNREAHRLKLMSGVRLGELDEALNAGDNDVLVAMAAIILSRHGKRFSEDVLWDAPVESGLSFELETIEDEAEEEDAGPPEPAAEPTPLRPTSGGQSSSSTLDSQENDPSRTGLPGSERSVVSGRAISAT